MPDALPRLLHFRVSHYNEKVRWALDYKGVRHRRQALLAGFHLPRVRRLTGQDQLPVLIVDGTPIHDSPKILAVIESRWPDPPLFPTADTEREQALAIQSHFDEQVAPEVRRLFWATYIDRPADCAKMATTGFSPIKRWTWRAAWPLMRKPFCENMGIDDDALARAHARLPEHLDWLEAKITPNGHLVGDRFTVADLTAAAVLTAIIRPPQFPYPLPEPWPQKLVTLRASIEHHPAFQWVLDIYRNHRSQSCEVPSDG